MTSKKRSFSGHIKSPAPETIDATSLDPAPPCAQPQRPSRTSTQPEHAADHPNQKRHKAPDNKPTTAPNAAAKDTSTPPSPPAKPRSRSRKKNRQKLQKLPPNTTISKRPLLHPAIPSPHASSSSSPKVLYITASTPFVPAVKRIRTLLAAIHTRDTQSKTSLAKSARGRMRSGPAGAAQPSGRLDARDVERGIVDAATGAARGKRGGEEEVYLKATGRAIPRALELGLRFQSEGGWRVGVEMGSVSAIDDIEVRRGGEGEAEGDKGEGKEEGEGQGGEEEIPEARIRTLSAVTVSIAVV
ncbi:hypothetical protein ACN47E_000328 [Coniothyrium glycines]